MSVPDILSRFRLLSYERGELKICAFAETGEKGEASPDFEEHVRTLRKEYGVDGLIYMTNADRILYFFTTDLNFEEETFLNSFFPRTHPELATTKIHELLGNTLLYQGEEAVRSLYEFALNPAHLAFIPPLLVQLLERSREYGINNQEIEMAIAGIMEKANDWTGGPLHFPKGRNEFKQAIEAAVLDLSRKCRESVLSSTFEQIPEKLSSIKEKAINQVFGKEFDSLDEKTKALAIRMMTFMEDQCKDIPREVLNELRKLKDS